MDYAGAGGTFEVIRHHLDNLMVRGPPRGYFPELIKSVLVVSPRNVLQAQAFFGGYGIHIVTGSRNLRGLRGVKGCAGSLAGGESGRLAVLSGKLGWGGSLAPAHRICGPVEVPPAGVVFRTTHHPDIGMAFQVVLCEGPLLLEGLLQARICGLRVPTRHPGKDGN